MIEPIRKRSNLFQITIFENMRKFQNKTAALTSFGLKMMFEIIGTSTKIRLYVGLQYIIPTKDSVYRIIEVKNR